MGSVSIEILEARLDANLNSTGFNNARESMGSVSIEIPQIEVIKGV